MPGQVHACPLVFESHYVDGEAAAAGTTVAVVEEQPGPVSPPLTPLTPAPGSGAESDADDGDNFLDLTANAEDLAAMLVPDTSPSVQQQASPISISSVDGVIAGAHSPHSPSQHSLAAGSQLLRVGWWTVGWGSVRVGLTLPWCSLSTATWTSGRASLLPPSARWRRATSSTTARSGA